METNGSALASSVRRDSGGPGRLADLTALAAPSLLLILRRDGGC